MKKKLKIVVISFSIIGVIIFLGYQYIINSGERDLKNEKINFSVKSKDISNEFLSNIEKANQKYLDKAISISGIVTSVNKNELIIDDIIVCNLEQSNNSSINTNQKVIISGRVVGYDDLLGELKLDKCFLPKNKE